MPPDPVAVERQPLDERAARLDLPSMPATDEFVALARGDQRAALALIENFARAWRKTVGRLIHDKTHDLVDAGEYGDPDQYEQVIGRLPDGSIEVEYDMPSEATDDAEDWLRRERPDLFEEYARCNRLAYHFARVTRTPSRVRTTMELSTFYFTIHSGLRQRRLDRRGARTGAKLRVRAGRRHARPRERRPGRRRRTASRAGPDDSSDSDGEGPHVARRRGRVSR